MRAAASLFPRREQRPNATQRGYDHRWRAARALFLQAHPLCVECAQQDQIVIATVVDHIIPHRGDQTLFWDQANWQPLCAQHHNRKTASGG